MPFHVLSRDGHRVALRYETLLTSLRSCNMRSVFIRGSQSFRGLQVLDLMVPRASGQTTPLPRIELVRQASAAEWAYFRCGDVKGVSDSRHPGPVAREGGSLNGKR